MIERLENALFAYLIKKFKPIKYKKVTNVTLIQMFLANLTEIFYRSLYLSYYVQASTIDVPSPELVNN